MQMLPRRLSHCFLNQEPFDEGMEYISALDFEGNRKDYCRFCWEKVQKIPQMHFWKGKIPDKKQRVQHPDEQAIAYFRQTTDLGERYVLALYLKRKQQLIQRTQTIYEVPDTGEIFEVKKRAFSVEEGAVMARQMEQLLQHFSKNVLPDNVT